MFRSSHRILALLVMVILTGCESYKPQPLSPETTAQELENRSLQAPELKNFLETNRPHEITNWPLESWNLENLMLAAFYFNPSLDVARAQWQIVKAEKISAGARPNPTVGISPEYNFNAASGISPWIYGATFDLPIETAGKRGYRIAQSKQLSASAKWNIAVAAATVRNNLRANLVEFVSSDARIKLLLRQKDIQSKIAEAFENELTAGAISPFEVATARISFAKTQLEMGDAEKQFAESRARLAEAIGIPASALAKVKFDFDLQRPTQNNLSESEIRSAALQNRPDILSALFEYAAKESALQLEIAKQYPDVHLGTGYHFDQGENKWSLGISSELPILNRNEGGIAEAKARRAETAARFVALQARVIGEIDRAVAIHRSAMKQMEITESLIAVQEKQHRTLQTQLDAGGIGRREMWNADLELAVAQLQKLDAVTKLQQAIGELENALQRPLTTIDFSKSPRAENGNEP